MSSSAAAAAAAEPDADAIAAAVLGCPAVARLGGADVADATTYLSGRRIRGVAVREHAVEVSVTGAAGATVAELAAQVRAAVTALIGDRVLDVRFADIDVPAVDAGQATQP